MSLNVFMRPHIEMLAQDYDLTLIANGVANEFFVSNASGVKIMPVAIARDINLIHDLKALLSLAGIFRREKFDAVHSITPKAGLLSMLAATLTRTPVRVHTFTGQVWATKSGWVREGLKALDRLIAWCATSLLTDSPSQRAFLIQEKIVAPEKIRVLGYGSVAGVDVNRFKPNANARQQIRSELHIGESEVVCLYLGRLNPDKGVQDLALAFAQIASQVPTAHLVIVGPDEADMSTGIAQTLAACSAQYHRVGFTNKPEDYMAAADIFCLPSYREGFGSVLIEAAAAGVPSLASKIYGITDAVDDGKTGILHEPKQVEQIAQGLLTLIQNDQLRKSMATQAQERAYQLFGTAVLVEAMRDFYSQLFISQSHEKGYLI
ncbi:MAG: glycosyltransferase [Polaromonas sp.]|nr:glycosyltransferase [Polaromonas sp.]